MNVIVCIKQVPETTEVKINPETNTLIREGVASIINPFDMYAIEEGIRLREAKGGKVTVITMGPPQAEAALRQTVAMGVDDAILVSDRAFAGSDTLATSYTLACAIRKLMDYDLILCGKQASDGDTAQVGPGIAQQLGIPFVTYVKKIEEVDLENKRLRVEKLIDEGYETRELSLPALLTVVKEINEPRLESLRGKIKAKSFQIPVWKAADIQANQERLGLNGSPTQVVKIFTPPRRKAGEIFEGDPADVADKLVRKLRENKVL